MERYTPQQRFFIAAWYECFRSPLVVHQEFRKKFGRNSHLPTRATIIGIHRKAVQHGMLTDMTPPGRPRSSTSGDIEKVRSSVANSPTLSVRNRAMELGMTKSSVERMLRQDLHMHPYVALEVQQLSDEDRAERHEFSQSMIEMIDNDESILPFIIFSDEAVFQLNGTLKLRFWAETNPHMVTERPMRGEKVTVWAGIWSGGFIGPFFFSETVNGERYLQMLEEKVLPELKKIEAFDEGALFWQQDGAPPHWFRRARDFLDLHFGSRWIGRGGPVAWPPRSPDLTPCDYYLWGHIRHLVFREKARNIDHLKERIQAAFGEIDDDCRKRAIAHFSLRMRLCAERGGDHIENLI